MRVYRKLAGFFFLGIISLILVCSATASDNNDFRDFTAFEEKEASGEANKELNRTCYSQLTVEPGIIQIISFTDIQNFHTSLFNISFENINSSIEQTLALWDMCEFTGNLRI